MIILLSIVLGTLFGYVLYRVGATHADKIISMLTFKDMALAKSIMIGIGLSSALYFAGIILGLFDDSHMSVKAMNLGVIVGGALLGFGWALSGMCPGTAVSNLGAGRKDALFFVVGGLLGAGVFSATYSIFDGYGIFEPMLGGKVSIASGDSNAWLAIAIGIGMVIIAYFLPKRLR